MAEASSAIRIPDAAVRAKYLAALGLIQSAEAPVQGGASPAPPATAGRMAYVAPLPSGVPKARRERSDLIGALKGADADPLLSPARQGILHALRRAVAAGLAVGDAMAEPLGFLDLGERSAKGLLSPADKDRFAAVVRGKALATTFAAAAHMASALALRAPAKDGEAGPVPASGSNDAVGWLVGLIANGVRGIPDDAGALAAASQACFDAMARCRMDAGRVAPGVLEGFQAATYAIDEDKFRVHGFDAPSVGGAKAMAEVATKRPEEVIGNHIAKAQAMRLARMLACFDFETGRNPFVEVGGFTFTAIGDGAPGTGKTTLIQMTVGLVKGYAELFGYPFRYENFSVDQISEYQGASGRNCRGFIDRILDRSSLGFGTIDDIDQVAGKRDDKRTSGGQQEVTAVLMEAFAGAGTVVRGNASFAMFSNFPENVDDALRQRAGARWLIDGPQSREDYVDILALLLGKSQVPLGDHQLYAAQALKRMVEQGYRQHDLPQEGGLRAVWDAYVGKNGVPRDIASLGGYLYAIKEREPRFTGRAIKNIADGVKNRSMDVDLPDAWFKDPQAFARKPFAGKVAMLSALRKPIDAGMVIQEVNRYADSEFRYADKSDEAEIARMVREHRLMEAASKRLQGGAS